MTNDHQPTTYEIENPLSSMLNDLASSFSSTRGAEISLESRKRLLALLDNADEELEMWGRAIGHVAWLASTHEDADKETLQALGTVALMQGKLLTISSALDGLKWEATHGYDNVANNTFLIDV